MWLYRNNTSSNMLTKNSRMEEEINAPQPIYGYFNRIDTVVHFPQNKTYCSLSKKVSKHDITPLWHLENKCTSASSGNGSTRPTRRGTNSRPSSCGNTRTATRKPISPQASRGTTVCMLWRIPMAPDNLAMLVKHYWDMVIKLTMANTNVTEAV